MQVTTDYVEKEVVAIKEEKQYTITLNQEEMDMLYVLSACGGAESRRETMLKAAGCNHGAVEKFLNGYYNTVVLKSQSNLAHKVKMAWEWAIEGDKGKVRVHPTYFEGSE